ncbi:MAG: hypothetical protein ACREHD_26765 [Pirellulales bacterium]
MSEFGMSRRGWLSGLFGGITALDGAARRQRATVDYPPEPANGDTVYQYDRLGRLVSVTTYPRPVEQTTCEVEPCRFD